MYGRKKIWRGDAVRLIKTVRMKMKTPECVPMCDWFFFHKRGVSITLQPTESTIHTLNKKSKKKQLSYKHNHVCRVYYHSHIYTVTIPVIIMFCLSRLRVRSFVCSVLCIYDLLEVVYLEVMCQIFQYMLLFRTNGLLLYKKKLIWTKNNQMGFSLSCFAFNGWHSQL